MLGSVGVVRQGCSLSPLMYLIYDEAMVKAATDNAQFGLEVKFVI